MDEYQVWHKDGEKYKQVAEVQAADPQTALLKTQHGLLAERWQEIHGHGSHARRTPVNRIQAISSSRDGQEYKFSALKLEGFYGTFPGFEPTHDIREQLYAEWIEDTAWRPV